MFFVSCCDDKRIICEEMMLLVLSSVACFTHFAHIGYAKGGRGILGSFFAKSFCLPPLLSTSTWAGERERDIASLTSRCCLPHWLDKEEVEARRRFNGPHHCCSVMKKQSFWIILNHLIMRGIASLTSRYCLTHWLDKEEVEAYNKIWWR